MTSSNQVKPKTEQEWKELMGWEGVPMGKEKKDLEKEWDIVVNSRQREMGKLH